MTFGSSLFSVECNWSGRRGEELTSCREYFSEAFRKDLIRGFRGQKALDLNGLTLTLPTNPVSGSDGFRECRNVQLLFLLPCIFQIVLLGRFAKASQAGAALRPAGRRAAARAETLSPCIRYSVMRPLAGLARAHCPKLEPLLEHGDLQSPGLVSLQV